MDVIIEDLKYKDIEECYKLNKLIFGEEFGLEKVKKLYKKIHKKKDNYRFLVAKLDGKIVGYTSVMISYNLFDGDKPLMNLWWVGTHPDYRRQGIATKMFRRLEEIAKEENCELIFFTSEADNISAHEFYKKWDLIQIIKVFINIMYKKIQGGVVRPLPVAFLDNVNY